MTQTSGGKSFFGWLAIGIAIIISTWIAASAWERVKMKPADRTIQVTGSAKKQIISDQIEWTASLQTQNMDRTAAYRDLHQNVQTALSYLKEQGVKEDEIRPGSVMVDEIRKTEYTGTGENRIEREVFKGYSTTQRISVISNDVARVERISREITQLLERGVPITSIPPKYYYTKLGELKIQMLAEAAKDARVRGENIVKEAGGAVLGKLRGADMGVINVNPINSTETSWEGRNDTTTLEKDIITIIHATFELN
jgi:hypothetical protein